MGNEGGSMDVTVILIAPLHLKNFRSQDAARKIPNARCPQIKLGQNIFQLIIQPEQNFMISDRFPYL